jgi:murein DD-endopeptidase MepM/ murein hydrolase activator NlpD
MRFRPDIAAVIAASCLCAPTLRAQAAKITAQPAQPQPGAIVRLTLSDPSRGDPIVSIRGALADEPLHFRRAGADTWHAIGGVPVDREGVLFANAVVQRASGKTEITRVRFDLPKLPPPPAQPLAVDSSFTRPLDAATQARIERENARARDIGKAAHERGPMWTASFIRPRASVITSEFGSGRVFNGELTARHLGVDFRGAMGEPVKAANRGVVALVDNFFLAGNVVYIDHGGGVVTSYFHLSKTLVHPGEIVQRGQVIGLVGNTGRVTGPHLHWAARYGANTVNPLDLIGIGSAWYSGAMPRAGASTQRQSERAKVAAAAPPLAPGDSRTSRRSSRR